METIKLLELFGGIGACTKAFERLGIPHEVVDYVEIDQYAVKSYNAIHGTNFKPQDIREWDKNIEVDLIMHGSPCFVKGTLVNTKAGLTNIEDIKVGDYVRSHDGTYKPVVVTMHHMGTTMNITAAATTKIKCTPNHPYYVYRNDEHIWINASNLKTSDYLCVPKNKEANKPTDFWKGITLNYNGHHETSNKLPLEDSRFWYLIGRFVGDGWVITRSERHGNISGIKICCAHDEEEELRAKIGNIFNYCVVHEKTVTKLQFCNKELGEFCNLFGRGAKNKHIPQEILNLDVKYLIPLLDGLLESDGCKTGRETKLTTISEKLAYNVGELVLKVLNKPYSIYFWERPHKSTIENRVVNQNDTFTVVWRDTTNDKINYVDDDYLYTRVRNINVVGETECVYNLEVEDTHSYCVYNVAVHNCQDFSLAGLQKGGDEGSGTRSSLMYETIRIVSKLKPKYVIWENVKNLVSEKHIHNFYNYIQRMRELGYKSYYKVLNAKDYGIPQNRERVFTISIRSDLHQVFEFPEPIPLKLRLKDMLEDEVDEKYYLSQKMLNYCLAASQDNKEKGIGFDFQPVDVNEEKGEVAKTIVSHEGQRMYNNFILSTKNKRLKETLEHNEVEDGAWIDDYNQLVNNEGVAGTIQEGVDYRNHFFIAQNEKQAKLHNAMAGAMSENKDVKVKQQFCDKLIENGLVKEGDIIHHNYTNNKMDNEEFSLGGENNVAPTIDTRCDCLGVTVATIPIKNATKQGYLLAKEGDGVDVSRRMDSHRGTVQDGLAQTINTKCDGGVVVSD